MRAPRPPTDRHAVRRESITFPGRVQRQGFKPVQLLTDIRLQGLRAHLNGDALRRIPLARNCDVDHRVGQPVGVALEVRSDGGRQMHFDRQRRFLIEYEAGREIERLAGLEPARFEREIAHDAARLSDRVLEQP